MQPDNLSLVALTPADVPAAQSELIDWCERKIAAIHTTLADLRENISIAKQNLWRHKGLQAAANREEKRVLYYQKIRAALQAGYLIIPNFPVDAFAVRVRPEDARRKSATYLSAALTDVTPHLLPAGEGEYVDDKRRYRDNTYKSVENGKEVRKGTFDVRKYDTDIDLPLVALKPTVLNATQRAMALRIFDQIGIVKQRKRDPIIVGQLVDPREKWPNTDQARVVTFFIAWWLNTEDL